MKIDKIIVCSVILIVLGMNTGCEDYLGGDTNSNPNKVNEVSLNALLPTVISATADNYYTVGFQTSQIVQYVASATATASNTDTHQLIRLNTSWTGIYLRALSNADILNNSGIEAASPHYSGIAKVLFAANLGLATDLWGDIPFSEAFQANLELTPAFDSQESIYNVIRNMLDDAITDLNTDLSVFSPGNDDLIFGGDLEKWVMTANSLKARYTLHLSKVDANAVNDAVSFAQQGIDANQGNLMLFYDERNLNPWHKTPALSNGTGNTSITFSEQLIKTMNGDLYGVLDPRLPIIAFNGGDPDYTGAINGSEAGEDSNSQFTVDTWYSTAFAPVLMITAAETKFIEAEAGFLANGGTDSSTGTTAGVYQAYLDGIAAHMDLLGVEETDKQTYLADPSVDVGADNLTLSLILKEKYIANFLNPETWVDFRRYDYSASIFPDLELPLNHNPDLNGEWIRRIMYPLDEFSRNETEVSKVQKGLGEKLWWDQ